MKTLIYLFFVLALWQITACTEKDPENNETMNWVEMPAEGAEWAYLYIAEREYFKGVILKYSKTTDTVLANNKKYKKWVNEDFYTRFDDGKFYKAIIEHDGRIIERLYYDFTLQKGDTFKRLNNAIVADVTTIKLADGVERRKITFDRAILYTPTPEIVWIEGIGDTQNGLFYDAIFETHIHDFLICYSESGRGKLFPEEELFIPCEQVGGYYLNSNPIFSLNKSEISLHTGQTTDSVFTVPLDPLRQVYYRVFYERTSKIEVKLDSVKGIVYVTSSEESQKENTVELKSYDLGFPKGEYSQKIKIVIE